MSEAAANHGLAEWRTPVILFVLTFASMMWVGTGMEEAADDLASQAVAGLRFAVPLMAILLAHEMGHYVAGRIHRVEISPPYFIPMPIFLLGTLGAVIRMGSISRRNALLDIGAAGPLAGFVVALPILVWGLHTSPVLEVPTDNPYVFIEGRGLLYLGVLYLLKGPIAEGSDIWLNGPALAGWAGLLVTQINLIPVAQLDGGHVAYALFGKRQDRYSKIVHRGLWLVGAAVGLLYVLDAYLEGERGSELHGEALAGLNWIVWAIVLTILVRLAGAEHPPTEEEPLTPARKVVAIVSLVLFVLLFMPSWIYYPTLPF